MTKLPLTMQQLEATAPDITYEVLTMIQAYDLYVYGGQRASRSRYADAYNAMANCALESFLLHYRALKEFLSETPKKNNDDIRATDYAPGWKASGVWIADAGETARIHKRLAHITSRRSNLDGLWNPYQMQQQVLDAFDELIRAVPAVAKSWFASIEKAISEKRQNVTGAISNSTVSITEARILFPPDLF
jgi:hypothetical protein